MSDTSPLETTCAGHGVHWYAYLFPEIMFPNNQSFSFSVRCSLHFWFVVLLGLSVRMISMLVYFFHFFRYSN